MEKKAMFIFMLFFTVCIMYVSAETVVSEKTTTGPPPLLENNNGSYAVDVLGATRPGYGNTVPPVYSAAVPGQPGSTGSVPLPPPPPGAMTPGMSVIPPGAAVPGGYPSTYSIDITPEKIQQVLSTVKEVKQYLKMGKIWLLKGPGGELEIRGGIMYQGAVVSVIEFSPANGSVLPADYRPVVYQENASLETIRDHFEGIVNNMQVLEGVWFSQPEACWIIPLTYNGKIITFLKVYTDGVHIIPDYEASREMAYYGQ